MYPKLILSTALCLLTVSPDLYAQSPPAYGEALGILQADRWEVKHVEYPRILDVLGRVVVTIENNAGVRKKIKLSQRNEDVATLAEGDTVRFTLAPIIRKGNYTFPAFDTGGKHKLPNPFLLDAGSYLILERIP